MKSLLFWIGATFLAALLIFAIFGPTHYDVTRSVGPKLQGPSAQFWLGTDHL